MGFVAAAVKSIPEILSELTELVQAGDLSAAKKVGRKLHGRADVRQLHLVARVVQVRENCSPRNARALVGQWWLRSDNEADRALIAACMPKRGERPRERRNQAAPYANRRDRRRAPERVTTEQRDDLIRRRDARQLRADGTMARYVADRAGVAEGPQTKDRDERANDEKVYASGFDYDLAALHGTDVPYRCLGCTISRGRYDLDAARVEAGTGDDGLCLDCRESGAVGIPELPVGLPARDVTRARCDFVFEAARAEFGASVAIQRLQSQWREAPGAVAKAVIGRYGMDRTAELAKAAAEEPAEQPAELSACALCSDPRTSRDLRGSAEDDGVCKDCRGLATQRERIAAKWEQDKAAWRKDAMRRLAAEAAEQPARVPA